jgi:MFS family permease
VLPPSHSDVSQLIQLAIAPVFLLTAVGTLLGVLSNRLGRVVDRIRALDERVPKAVVEERRVVAIGELVVLGRRMRLIYAAMALAVMCALFVGLSIVTAFVNAFLSTDMWRSVAVLFIASMLCFICSLCVFLREIFLAVTNPHSPMR